MSGNDDKRWEDRRAAPRCAYSATAIVYVGNEKLVCRAVDISSGGMLIIPPTRGARGSFLRVNLSLPSFDEVLDPVREQRLEHRHVAPPGEDERDDRQHREQQAGDAHHYACL